MKIPQSVRNLYQALLPKYEGLKVEVDRLVQAKKEQRWHYEGRVKGEQSYAQKLETGRERNPAAPEDFFACTLVVENFGRIADAEKFITTHFDLLQRRPRESDRTHLAPHNFDFDDLRLYVRWRDDTALKPSGFKGTLFEVQIKTFLQHAWGIATHDFVYKAEELDWSSSRIAYQVKAMLENAELSIGEAKRLTDCAMLSKVDDATLNLREMIGEIKNRWEPERLPTDLRRLALTIDELIYWLRIDFRDLWEMVDAASRAGAGAKTLNLSPYAAIIVSLISARGVRVLAPLAENGVRFSLFVPLEIDLPDLDRHIARRIVRPVTPEKIR